MRKVTSLSTHLVRGAIAGAVGTTALNATTFLDMAVRARPASSTPEQVVERGARLIGASLPEDEDDRQARTSGIGSLLGALAGVSAGVVLGALQATGRPRSRASTLGTAWGVAMLAGNGPMTALKVTDPRSWSAGDWAADVAPHLAYAVAAVATLDAFETTD